MCFLWKVAVIYEYVRLDIDTKHKVCKGGAPQTSFFKTYLIDFKTILNSRANFL